MVSTMAAQHDGMVPAADFKLALRHFASGVTVITTLDEAGAAHGMTATAFSSLSLDPPLVMVAISRRTRCHALVAASGRFGVSVLYDHQLSLSRHFGGQPLPGAAPPFAWLGETPIVKAAMVALACVLQNTFEGGDHSIFTGLVEEAVTAPGQPLLHFDGRYRTLSTER